MKSASVYQNTVNRPAIPRPDAVTRRKMLDRFVDQLMMVAVGVASMAILLFFMTLA